MAVGAISRIHFGPIVLDVDRGSLTRGDERIGLRPKVWELLRVLIERRDRLVAKEELFASVWPGVAVHQWALSNCISELRSALGDEPAQPRYIAVVHRRGYRWIAPVVEQGEVSVSPPSEGPLAVGREQEIARLRHAFDLARGGHRQFLFVSGEPGIGKTAVIDEFLRTSADGAAIGRGQSVDHHAASEPYLPVLEALSLLCRGPNGAEIVDVLRQHAPLWLAQMPSFLTVDERSRLQSQLHGAARERMLREMGEAIEVLANSHPLVLVLEDLHWCDHATVDLLAYLARRREPVRLLLLATYRPVNLLLGNHPLRALKRELEGSGIARELALPFLTPSAIQTYLATRFPGHQFPPELATIIHRKTDGNPLFMVTIVDYFRDEGWFERIDFGWQLTATLDAVHAAIPDSLKQMMDHRIEELPEADLDLMMVASVIGTEFSTPTLAAAAGLSQEQVEEQCATLARRQQMVAESGPRARHDDAAGIRFNFRHALYQSALLGRIGPARRRRLHETIAQHLERTSKQMCSELCAELALHYDLAGNVPKAVHYLRDLAARALQRGAFGDARASIEHALAILPSPASTPVEIAERFDLTLHLTAITHASHGHASPEAEQYIRAAAALSEQIEQPVQRFQLLSAMYARAFFRSDFDRCAEIATEMRAIDAELDLPQLTVPARVLPAGHIHATGRLEECRELLEETLRFDIPAIPLIRPGLRVIATSLLARVHTLLGFADRGRQLEAIGMKEARDLGPFDTVYALGLAAARAILLRNLDAAQRVSLEAMDLIDLYGFVNVRPYFESTLGCCRVFAGNSAAGITAIREAMQTRRSLGIPPEVNGVYWFYALALVEAGTPEAATEIDAGIAWAEGRRDLWAIADLYRLRGECWRARPDGDEHAERCFEQAIHTAQAQKAKWWELRATISLAQLYRDRDRGAEGRTRLRPVYDWFREGLDTADLERARQLLCAQM